MRSIISESPNGKQRIVIDPSSETVTFHGCHISPAKSFFSIARPQAEFVCRFEDILSVHEVRVRGFLHIKKIVTAHGSTVYGAKWTNFDETWNMLRSIGKTAPDYPIIEKPDIAGIFIIGGLAVIVLILIFIYFWLTGDWI